MKKQFLLLYLVLFTFPAFSQDIKKGEVYFYARRIVDTLASAGMHGRGYVNNGDKIAARYISNEFESFGLKSFGKNYYQEFNFPINTFPGRMSVQIDGTELVPGKDYIIKPSFHAVKASYPVFMWSELYNARSKRKIRKSFALIQNNFVVLDSTVTNSEQRYNPCQNSAPGVITHNRKLTWDMSMKTDSCLEILVLNKTNINKAKSVKIDIENRFFPSYTSQNVIGYVEGAECPDSFIVFSAHYDHLGQMGSEVYFPGANDNASGCAMLLNLAKYYSRPENKPKYSIVFMAFSAEEVGLVGSRYYTEHPLFDLPKIKFLLNMDIMGTGEDGITVVNGSVYKDEFERLKALNAEEQCVSHISMRGKAANSDHYFFSEKGVKSFFIYTMGGIKAYHDIYDRPETLPLNKFEDLFQLITKFSWQLQN
jgi:hypothetical protein